jgi:transcriptional regulator with XRE-family HTH domain
MIIGDRLRVLREDKKLSQGDVEKRTGLLRCYISRVENGHTVPAIETLEKMARAFEVPMYQLFYDGEEPPKLPNLPKRNSSDEKRLGQYGQGCAVSEQASAVCWANQTTITANSFYLWLRKWPGASHNFSQ